MNYEDLCFLLILMFSSTVSKEADKIPNTVVTFLTTSHEESITHELCWL